MLRTRTRLALFPVVDRLRRGPDQQAAFGCRQSKAAPLGSHALGAEARAWCDGVFVSVNRPCRLPSSPESAKVALGLENSALECRDLGTVSRRGLLQDGWSAPNRFASNAADF